MKAGNKNRSNKLGVAASRMRIPVLGEDCERRRRRQDHRNG
jgi:hypothetical protein